MKLAGKTDVGRVRQENQDDYRAGELPGGAVWALVCDGMGGAKGGREASQGACNVIEQVFQEQYAQCGAGQEGAFLKNPSPPGILNPKDHPCSTYNPTKKRSP